MTAPASSATATRAAPGARRLSSVARVRLLQLTGVLSFLGAWQVLGGLDPRFYSTPALVAVEIKELFLEDGLLGTAFGSVWTLLVGLALAFIFGVGFGLLTGYNRVLRVMFEPYMAAFYSVPRVAFVPIMVVWFGITQKFVVASVIMACAIVLAFATAAGVRETALRYAEVSNAFEISGWQMFRKVLLPGAVPFIATGTRLAMQRGLVAVIVAEFLVGVPGVGFVIRLARVNLATDRLFAMAILLMMLGIVLIGVTKRVEDRFSSWRPQAFEAGG